MDWKEKIYIAMALLKEGCEDNTDAGVRCSECPMYHSCFKRELEHITPNIWDMQIIRMKYFNN